MKRPYNVTIVSPRPGVVFYQTNWFSIEVIYLDGTYDNENRAFHEHTKLPLMPTFYSQKFAVT